MNDETRQSPSSNGKPHDGDASGSAMIITGRVTNSCGRGLAAVLVEATDVRDGETVRLASASVDGRGAFNVVIPSGVAKRPINLQVRVLAPERPDTARDDRLLFASEVRERAGLQEHFLIELPDRSIAGAGLSVPTAEAFATGDGAVTAERERLSALREIKDEIFDERLSEVKERRDLFRKSIRGALSEAMSSVTSEERGSGRFVPTADDIPSVAAAAIVSDVRTLTGISDPETSEEQPAIERPSRLLLTTQQLSEIFGESDEAVVVSEAELEAKLDASLDKPPLIFRRSLVADPCRPRTAAEACLDPEEGEHDHDEEEDNGEDEGEDGDEQDGGSDNDGSPPAFKNKKSIDALMERQASPEDPLVFGIDHRFEPSLAADQVSTAIAGVTFQPGPADVPALHFFTDLQVAFEPIWHEALDTRFLDDVESAYDKFVERGGAPAVERVKGILGLPGTLEPGRFLNELLDIASTADTDYESVASVVLITREEWGALPAGARTYLSQIAAQISQIRQALVASIDANDMSWLAGHLASGSTSALLNASLAPYFSGDAIQLRAKLRLLKSDADGIVALARRLVLEVEASRPFRPTHTIIDDLKQQHQRAYPFRLFAASPTHRSINFGLQVTYKQIWTLKAYQVGELVSTIPLAPGEVRKYSRRTLRRRKRAVQEVESRFERRTGESEERARIESEIVHRAHSKTNFSLTSTGTVSYGAGGGGSGDQQGGGGMGASASHTATFQRDVEKHSDSVKKEFNEAIRKATEEVKNERRTEISTEEISEEEVTQSGELSNPNKEIPCTFLLYELQRRIGIEEKIHGLQAVVLVAQEVPTPAEIDVAWLIRHDWIISRVLLDPSYAPALGYVSTTLISDDVALRETREALFRQRKLVEDLKQDLAERRGLAGLRYAALQKQIERTADSAEGGDGLFGGLMSGIGDALGGIPVVGDFVEGALDMVTGEGEVSQADQLREGAARDAYDREQRDEQEIGSRVMAAIGTLESMQRDYTERLSRHLTELGQVHRLIDHIWQNILYYMQAIWAHEPDDQRFMRLKDTPIPTFEKDKGWKRYTLDPATFGVTTDLMATDGHWVNAKTNVGIAPPPREFNETDWIKTVPLSQVADIYRPTGVIANYLVFPMFASNPVTEFMMDPYVTLAEGEYGVSDPDPLGNMTLAEFAEYVCCLREHFEKNGEDGEERFEALKPELREVLKKLLQRSRRDGDIVIPCEDGLYIEALPGSHSVLEQYQHLHRIIDVKSAQADLRSKELDNVRRAERILQGELEDPEIESKYVFEGDGTIVGPHP